MSRGLRKAATPKLPDNVKWATQVPILVIPSGGHSGLSEGTEIATGPNGQRRQQVERRTPTNSRRENEVRLRYPACCDQHKGQIKVESLVTEQELRAVCSRLTQHHGHGALNPRGAWLEWAPCEDKIPCSDCLGDAAEKAR